MTDAFQLVAEILKHKEDTKRLFMFYTMAKRQEEWRMLVMVKENEKFIE